jgi:hypothetical protein
MTSKGLTWERCSVAQEDLVGTEYNNVYILFNCANKIFSSYGTSLRGKTLAGYLSFPFIIGYY